MKLTSTYSLTSNRRRYASKEEQAFLGKGRGQYGADVPVPLLDFSARMYDPFLCRWTAPDPRAAKSPSLSPYAYCAGNPVNFIDPDGLSYSEFDENGNYLRTIKDNKWHNFWHGRSGRIVNGNGEVTQSFNFSDPKHDVSDLKKGVITKIQFVKENEIVSMLSKAGAFYDGNKAGSNKLKDRYDYVKEEGKGDGGKLNFADNENTGLSTQYDNHTKSLFLVDGMAYNSNNYGIFLFGAAGKTLGLFLLELELGAQVNSLLNQKANGYPSQFDSFDDQRSIRMGVQHAKRNNYQKMRYGISVGPLIY